VIHERIEVIYQEILVRAFSGSQPVPGLKAGDFTLFENGKKVEIAHCRELRRSLAAQPPSTAARPAEASRPRLFLFMLWFNEESPEWPKAWEYFRSRIYRPGDRVILSDGLRALEIFSLEEDKEKIAVFLQEAATTAKNKKLDKLRLVSEMENSANDFYDGLVTGLIQPKLLLDEFKVRYQGAINEYRLARLKGYPRWLERLAAALKAVEAEKWVLVFLQNERLPLLSKDCRLVAKAPVRSAGISSNSWKKVSGSSQWARTCCGSSATCNRCSSGPTRPITCSSATRSVKHCYSTTCNGLLCVPLGKGLFDRSAPTAGAG
jgi:hypothetical protein